MKIKFTNTDSEKPIEMVFSNIQEVGELLKHINMSEKVKTKGMFFLNYDLINCNHFICWESRKSKNNYLPDNLHCIIQLEATADNYLYVCLKNYFLDFIYFVTNKYKPPICINKASVERLDFIKLYKLYRYFVNWNNEPFTKEKYEIIITEDLVTSESFII